MSVKYNLKCAVVLMCFAIHVFCTPPCTGTDFPKVYIIVKHHPSSSHFYIPAAHEILTTFIFYVTVPEFRLIFFHLYALPLFHAISMSVILAFNIFSSFYVSTHILFCEYFLLELPLPPFAIMTLWHCRYLYK